MFPLLACLVSFVFSLYNMLQYYYQIHWSLIFKYEDKITIKVNKTNIWIENTTTQNHKSKQRQEPEVDSSCIIIPQSCTYLEIMVDITMWKETHVNHRKRITYTNVFKSINMIKFTSCLPMVSGSCRVLQLFPPLKLVAMI